MGALHCTMNIDRDVPAERLAALALALDRSTCSDLVVGHGANCWVRGVVSEQGGAVLPHRLEPCDVRVICDQFAQRPLRSWGQV